MDDQKLGEAVVKHVLRVAKKDERRICYATTVFIEMYDNGLISLLNEPKERVSYTKSPSLWMNYFNTNSPELFVSVGRTIKQYLESAIPDGETGIKQISIEFTYS